jgi:hypothetical protein
MLTNAEFLTPVLALVVWTLVMWVWLYATRLPAMKRAGVAPQDARFPGSVAPRLPEHARSVADNYNHLHEQPTIFYALMFFIAFTGGADGTAHALAWAYVVTRIAHSLVQATINLVVLRFAIFALGSLLLVALAAREVLRLGA